MFTFSKEEWIVIVAILAAALCIYSFVTKTKVTELNEEIEQQEEPFLEIESDDYFFRTVVLGWSA